MSYFLTKNIYKSFWKIIAVIAIIPITACSTTHEVVPDPEFAPVRPVSSRPLPINNGSIYKAGFNVTLFEDAKARRVGDIITIILQESTNASKSASTSTNKDSSIDLLAPIIGSAGATGLLGKLGTELGRLSASVDGSRDFTGEGDSSQSNALTGMISVTVSEVFPNGNLAIQGEKLLTLNQGSEHVRISGIVRSSDVSPTNTIPSAKVANAKIVYGGQGAIAEANTKGWAQRVFDSNWWPF